jgi:signal transduction histidine kinase
VNEKGITPFLINNKEVFTSSLWYKNPRLFIGTFSDGLWIKTDTILRHFTTANFLTSNVILRTKATNNHLWLFENEAMQVLDIETETLLQNIDLPKVNGANVFDVAEWQGYGYLTTSDGIYKIPMNTLSEDKTPAGYLDAVIVNNRDTLQSSSHLSYSNNDLQFIFSSPAFYDPNTVFFRYRLLGADKNWQTTKQGERTIRYASLPAGNYTLQAYAINKKGVQQIRQIVFDVVINKPWWKQGWFYFLCFLLVVGVIYLFQEYRLRQLLRVERVRRKISTDLHDDIGATLSSINIYAELAKKERTNDIYFNAIQEHAHEVISKLDDLIWSINPRNDNFEQLVNRMHSYADPLLQAKNISCRFNHSENLLKEKLPLQIKQNLYLVFKELINNVVKHSGATQCIVDIACRNNTIYLIVLDDGKGFDVNISYGRNGISNIKERVEKMKGRLQIESIPGAGTTAMTVIPLPQDYLARYKKWIKKQIS